MFPVMLTVANTKRKKLVAMLVVRHPDLYPLQQVEEEKFFLNSEQ